MSDSDNTEVEVSTDATKREGPGSVRHKLAEPPLERGTAVGRYLIIDVLGEGGMGVVYAAFDPELDRKVAVKLLQAHPAGGMIGDQAWLLREAQAMARLSHPNVIAVHDVGTLPGDRVFIAMEYIDGVTLRDWIHGQKRSWQEVVPVMLAAGAGLAAAHAGGLVHRDFKPDNVLLGKDRVRVMDFGLAQLRDPDDDEEQARDEDPGALSGRSRHVLSENLTVAGSVAGTPAYMSPEVKDGAPADARSDQFSFGVALYEALFWARPFAKNAPRIKPRLPTDTSVPARIQRLVLRAISLDPAERFRSMDALLAELAVDVGARRRRAVIAAAVVIGLGGAAVGGFALSRAPGSNDQQCSAEEQRLAGTWDPAIRGSVRAAFDATKKPFAKQSFDGLERALDTYTGDWVKAAADACQATRVRRQQPQEVLELREACLRQRLDELRALTTLLASADADLVASGDKVVWGLDPVSRCSDVAALRSPGLPPTEPKDKVAELNQRLAESKAALIAGRFLRSIETAKQAEELADAIGYPPYKAEALVVHGASLAGVGGSTDEAARVFSDAAYAALASNRFDVAAKAAQAAAIIASQTKLGEARIWLGLAKSSASRFPFDAWLAQRQLQAEGLVAGASGDVGAAIVAHKAALVVAERRLGMDSPALWNDEDVIAVTYAKSGAYDKARPHFERALALHERSVGPDHPDLAGILTNLGICYAQAGDESKARAAYERALSIRERIEGPKNPMLILTLNNMADGLIKAGDTTGALFYLDRAKQLAAVSLGRKNPLYQVVATTRAEALIAAGRLDDGRREYDEVLQVETETQSPVLGGTLSSRGMMAIRAKNWTEAVFFLQRAISALETTGGKESPELWQPLTELARAQLELRRGALARPLLERAIVIGEKAQISAADLAPTRLLLTQLRR